MPSAEPPVGASVTYSRQFRRCGKPGCAVCGEGPGHGPYWYAYWWEDGKTRSRYIGVKAPPGVEDAAPPPPVRRAGSSGRAALRVRTLGGFEVWRCSRQGDEQALPAAAWNRRKATALFKCLLGAPGQRLHREQIVEALWPDAQPEESLTSLRTTIYLLRKILDRPGATASHVQADGESLILVPAPGAEADADWLDAAAFAREARAALLEREVKRCRAALSYYRGDYLPADTYDEWAVTQRDTLREHYLAVLVLLAHLIARDGTDDPATIAEAEQSLRAVLDVDPCHEDATRALMRMLARTGRRGEALRAYQALAAALRDEFNIAPNRETETLRSALLAEDDSAPRQMPAGIAIALIIGMRPQAGYDALLARAVEAHEGQMTRHHSADGPHLAIFSDGDGALAAAVRIQRELQHESAAQPAMALHTGQVLPHGSGPGLDHGSRLCVLAHSGQILVSQTTELLLRDTLPSGVHLRPLGAHHIAGATRPEQVFQALHPDLRAEFPPLKASLARAQLPLALTSFIGREDEVAAVRACLSAHEEHRLITLTGAGGCGKTRLALQVANQAMADFPDGTWLVELAALTDATLLPYAVAAALGVPEEPARPLISTLAAYLQSRRLLLVLDNCEHLVAACAELVLTLLRACPQLCILATSQQALGIAGEETRRLPSLAVPDPQHLPPLEKLPRYEAVQLFLERARATRPGFTLQPEHAWAVAQICHRLDGIPLAIELAAARIGMLSPSQLAARLDDRFAVLTGGSRTALPRHQTLRAAMDWSYNLLEGPERALFNTLAVFAGTWTYEMAEAVAGQDVLDPLSHLVARSLVIVDEQGTDRRYRLLQTVRAYAAEQLSASDMATEAHRRHRDWFLALAEKATGELSGSMQETWIAHLETEHDNLRAALTWSIASAEREGGDYALRLAAALQPFWQIRGYLREGRRWLDEALAAGNSSPAARARALEAAGHLAYSQGDYLHASALLEEGLALQRKLEDQKAIVATLATLGELAREQADFKRATALFGENFDLARATGDQAAMIAALSGLAGVAYEQGDLAQATAWCEQSLAFERGRGNTHGIARMLTNLGIIVQAQGDYDRAAALQQEGLALKRELGNKRGIANSLDNLGRLAADQGDYQHALSLLEESLTLGRELGDARAIANTLITLGQVSSAIGAYREAGAQLREALSLFRDQNDRAGIAAVMESLAAMAAVAVGTGVHDPARAALLCGAATALRNAIGAPRVSKEQTAYEHTVAIARALLEGAAFDEAWAAGHSMDLNQTIARCLTP